MFVSTGLPNPQEALSESTQSMVEAKHRYYGSSVPALQRQRSATLCSCGVPPAANSAETR